MTTDQVLTGIALTLVLAVGSQVLAAQLRIPALIVLLPAGFAAGALVDDIDPQRLLGPSFAPLVSLAVAVILYDAGLGLDLRKLRGHIRRVVVRLLWLGVLISWGVAVLVAEPLLGLSTRAAVMLGAILVVSGPTVVGPLLTFVRPKDRLRHILIWEGSLIDPVGGILGALVFHAVSASARGHVGSGVIRFVESMAVGVAGGVLGAALLWPAFRKLRLGELLGTTVQLAAVVGTAALCDIVREDTGLIAAITMGLALANLPGIDVPARLPFFETLVSLIIGVMFISISATVTPQSLRHVALPAVGLAAALVVVARPLAALLSTLRTDLSVPERAFVGWMAPRGIVAASTASTFSAALVARGIGGAEKILPATFVVIVATVTLYGLTASAVARRLGVTRPARSQPLLVGGEPWVIDLGRVLQSLGLEILMWAGLEEQRERIAQAGLDLVPGEFLAAATGEGAELEGISTVLLLTTQDDFNALAATVLAGSVDGPVQRVRPMPGSHGVVATTTGGDLLFGPGLTRPTLTRRYDKGSRIVARQRVEGDPPAGHEVLFVVRADGRLVAAGTDVAPVPRPGDIVVSLGPEDHGYDHGYGDTDDRDHGGHHGPRARPPLRDLSPQ